MTIDELVLFIDLAIEQMGTVDAHDFLESLCTEIEMKIEGLRDDIRNEP